MFGVRLPQSSDCLTSIDFDLVPNKPPPGVKIYDEEIEEIEESEEEDEDMEPAPIPESMASGPSATSSVAPEPVQEAPFPISALPSVADARMASDNGSDVGDEDDGLFAGGDDDDSDAMEEVQTTLNEGAVNGMKRKLVETDDYD